MLSVHGLTKRFGRFIALDDVTVDFHAGEVHAVLGENGAGKSTLMNLVYGLLQADAGEILLDDNPVEFSSPIAARQAGIGMVHQEFALVDAFSVTENLAIGLTTRNRWHLDHRAIAAEAAQLAESIGLDIGDLDATVGTLPVGVRQRIEILKALAGNARVLILDEPTAVLTPGEIAQLFHVLAEVRSRGTAILFITHKLGEVMEIADRVTVLRRGRLVSTLLRVNTDERMLAEMMIGALAEPLRVPEMVPHHTEQPPRLRLEHLCVQGTTSHAALHEIDLDLRAGEIFGIAGVDGNGQSELFEVLLGIQPIRSGTIHLDGVEISRASIADRLRAGLGLIPPDRQRQGLVLPMRILDNGVLDIRFLDRIRLGPFLPPQRMRSATQSIIDTFSIRTPGIEEPAASLSGGNQQKLIVGRTLALEPQVLVAFNPTRGLDVGAARSVYDALLQAAVDGAAVLLISTDLDEVLQLSHRVTVLFRGSLSAPLRPPFIAEALGAMMAGQTHVPVAEAETTP